MYIYILHYCSNTYDLIPSVVAALSSVLLETGSFLLYLAMVTSTIDSINSRNYTIYASTQVIEVRESHTQDCLL